MANKTENLSLPKTVTVRGIAVQRLPLGGYLQALQLLEGIPGELMKLCFPEESLSEVINHFKQADEGLLERMLTNALLSAPKYVIQVVAQLLTVPEERLLEDAQIGLDGLVELVSAWVEVNGLLDFMPAVRKLQGTFRTALGGYPRQNIGSNG